MQLSYLGFMMESNMFLTPTTPNDIYIQVLIDNIKVN